MRSRLYVGEITHYRFGRQATRFRYRSVSLLLDLDEIAALDGALRSFSVNRPNLYAFYPRDHADGCTNELKAWALGRLPAAGLSAERIELLCFPRILGTVFNPLAIFFCYDAAGRLAGTIHQVSNTLCERHSYVMPAREGASGWVRQQCDKAFYVSPFLPEQGRYRFRFKAPGARLAFRLGFSAGKIGLFATHSARSEALTDRALLWRLLTHPAMTAKVIAGIRWQALKLWSRGARVYRHRPAPAHVTTIVDPATGRPILS